MNIMITSIGRRGYFADFFKEADSNIRLVGTSNTNLTHGFKYCQEKVLLPNIIDAKYQESLIESCKKFEVDILLSAFDLDIDYISNFSNELNKLGIVTFLPTKETSQICFDKYLTFEFLKKNNINTPKTYIDLDKALTDLNNQTIKFPLIVKPKNGFASQNIFRARSLDELKVFFNYNPDMVIQEMIQGNEYSFDILHDLEGNVINVFCKKKISMRAGETDQAITVFDEKLIEFGFKLGNIFDNKGPMDVDFFITNEGDISVLEINPRFGGGYPISHKAGAAYPKKMIEMVRGKVFKPEIVKYDSITMMKGVDFYYI